MTNLERYIKGKGLDIWTLAKRTGYPYYYVYRSFYTNKFSRQLAFHISRVLKIDIDFFYELTGKVCF